MKISNKSIPFAAFSRLLKKASSLLAIALLSISLLPSPGLALADSPTSPRNYPGAHGLGPSPTDICNSCLSSGTWLGDPNDYFNGGPGVGGYDYGYNHWQDPNVGWWQGPGSSPLSLGWQYSPAGWWYMAPDGTWPSNQWKFINARWYRFDQGGHMVTGWFTDGNGLKYYLSPVDDGTLGAMRTGWQVIGGKAYYFNALSDGSQGRLLVNTTTPDGYKVGPDGAMAIQ